MIRFATKLAPQKRKIATAQAAGFRNAELWLNAEFLNKAERILRNASRVSMKFVPHFPNRGKLSRNQLRNAVSLYKGLGCRAMVIHPPRMKQYGDALLDLNPSLCLAVENGGMPQKKFWKWARKNKWLNIDVEHLWKYTLDDCPLDELLETFRTFLDRHSSKVKHVHLPGYDVGSSEHRPAYFNAELATSIWSLLEEYDFSGFVVSEANEEFQTLKHLRRDVGLFEQWREGGIPNRPTPGEIISSGRSLGVPS